MAITLPPTPVSPNRRFELPKPLHMRGGWRKLLNDNIGMMLIITAQFFGTCMSVTVKLLNTLDPPISSFEIVLIRMSITYVFAVSVLHLLKVEHPITGPPGVRHLLAIRGVCGFFGLFGMYYSLQYLSLSDAITITFLIPTSTAIAASFFLKESISKREIFAGLLSLVGVILIARPESLFGPQPVTNGSSKVTGPISEKGTPAQRLFAVGVALMGVLGATGAFISIRSIGKRAHALHSMSWFSLWCCIVSSLGMWAFGIPLILSFDAEKQHIPEITTRSLGLTARSPSPFLSFPILMLGVGVSGFMGQLCMTLGLQRESAGRASLGLYVQILFATAAEKLVFHTNITDKSWMGTLGTIIILGSAAWVLLNKRSETKNSSDVERGITRDEDLVDEDTEIYALLSRSNGSQESLKEGVLESHWKEETSTARDGRPSDGYWKEDGIERVETRRDGTDTDPLS